MKTLKTLKKLSEILYKPQFPFRKVQKLPIPVSKVEKLREIGTYLQQVRTEQGVSLETISQDTRLQLRSLKAIEDGDLQNLPEPVYIRSFIQKYANTLGLDGTAVASEFPIDSPPTHLQQKTYKTSFWGLDTSLKPIHLYVFYVILVIFTVEYIGHLVKGPELQTNTSAEDSTSVVFPLSPVAEPVVQPSQVNHIATAKHPMVVEVSVKADSWIRVIVDGKKQFEGNLSKGSNRTWEASKEVTIRAGNAAGVYVTINDQKAQQLGKPGQVQEITLQADVKPPNS